MQITITNALRAEIAAAYGEYAMALAQHDAVALAALYEHDAVILIPGAKPVCGHDAIRAYCQGLCALPYDFERTGFTIEHMLTAGDYVIEISSFTSSHAPVGDPQNRATTYAKTLMVWRNARGRWRIAREMYSDVRG